MAAVEILAGLSGLKAALDIAKGLKDITDVTARTRAVIELQEKILSARETQSTLLDQVGELEKEVARLKAWDGEKERYELKELRRGLFAYIIKEGKEGGEPPHALCATCYQRGIKSFLQSSGDQMVHDHFWKCPECGFSAKNQFRNMVELIKKSRELTQS